MCPKSLQSKDGWERKWRHGEAQRSDLPNTAVSVAELRTENGLLTHTSMAFLLDHATTWIFYYSYTLFSQIIVYSPHSALPLCGQGSCSVALDKSLNRSAPHFTHYKIRIVLPILWWCGKAKSTFGCKKKCKAIFFLAVQI